MKWQKTHDGNFLQTTVQDSFHTEVVGDYIYISHDNLHEFFIYDPGKHLH